MADSYQVTFKHRNTTQTLTVPSTQTILDAALAQDLDLPHSCLAGVCTTCAGRILSGTIEQTEAIGIAPELKDQGYALLCVSYPRSAVEVESDKEDEIYTLQFETSS